jgi:hypothetical protein
MYPSAPMVDGGALVIYTGTADRSVEWSLTGNGTLTPITEYTDHNGVAAARYDATAGSPSALAGASITITVTAGA